MKKENGTYEAARKSWGIGVLLGLAWSKIHGTGSDVFLFCFFSPFVRPIYFSKRPPMVGGYPLGETRGSRAFVLVGSRTPSAHSQQFRISRKLTSDGLGCL